MISERPHPAQPPLRKRDTPDLIVAWLAGIVGVVVLATVVGAIVWKISDSDADITELVSRVGDIVNTLIGAVVGYLAGRGVVPDGYQRTTQQSPDSTSERGEV